MTQSINQNVYENDAWWHLEPSIAEEDQSLFMGVYMMLYSSFGAGGCAFLWVPNPGQWGSGDTLSLHISY